MTKPFHYNIRGLYVITPEDTEVDRLCAKVKASLDGGAHIVQYRTKLQDANLRLRQSTALLALCRSYGVPFIVNDYLDLCAQIDADGLHLGITDCDLSAARRLLGPNKIIGASCYNHIDLAVAAHKAGADYLAFGACFTSETKPEAVNAPLSLFAEAKILNLPLVAIGGINLQNAPTVLAAGADALAVITDIFLDDDIQGISRQYSNMFNH